MRKSGLMILLAVLLLTLVIANTVRAMDSDNYTMDWFVLMNGSGGGESTSTNYTINFTVGQTAIDESSSANYTSGLGYWYGLIREWFLHLPSLWKGTP